MCITRQVFAEKIHGNAMADPYPGPHILRITNLPMSRLLPILATAALVFVAAHARTHRDTAIFPQNRDTNPRSTDGLAAQALRRLSTSPYYNVEDYGAKGDNATDNTGPFQAALTAAANAGGGTVLIPAGLFVFQGCISVPSGVNLKGTYEVVPSHQMVNNGPPPNDGSVLMPYSGRGDTTSCPFISVNSDSTFSGVSILWYPSQSSSSTPIPFPYTISMSGNNAAVTDVELLNSYNGIYAVQAHRHYIARVQGQPTNIGIFVDETYDIGRIEDVHFNPWYSADKDYVSYQTLHGTAFVFGRSDWEYVLNTFAFGYAVGYHFIQTSTGSMNGNFLGLGADLAVNASVLVDASQPPGLLITNGEFTAFSTPDWAPNNPAKSSQVVINPSNTGPVRFVDTAFWGPSDAVARLHGSGLTSFTSCEFVQWNLQNSKDNAPAIHAFGGSLIVMGNDFQQNGTQVILESGVEKAVIVGNVVTGQLNIVNNGMKRKPQIGFNAADIE